LTCSIINVNKYLEINAKKLNLERNLTMSGISPSSQALACPEHARSGDQATRMHAANQTGTCPLCQIDWGINKELYCGVHWRVMLNAFPYPHHASHLILVAKRHVTDICDLTTGEWAEWGKLNAWAIQEYKLPGGGIAMRFGSFEQSGATIAHLHSHIQVPDGTGPAVAVFKISPKLLALLTPPAIKAGT